MLVSSGFPKRPQIYHFPDSDLGDRCRLHGRGCITRSAAVLAGDNVDLILRFELGETAIPAGGHLRVAWLRMAATVGSNFRPCEDSLL